MTTKGDLYATDGQRFQPNGAKFHFVDAMVKSVAITVIDHAINSSVYLCYTKVDGSLNRVIGNTRFGGFQFRQQIDVPPVRFFYLMEKILIFVDVNGKCHWLDLESSERVPNKLDYAYGQIVKMVPENGEVYFFTQDNFCHSLTFIDVYEYGMVITSPFFCVVTDEKTISRVTRTLACASVSCILNIW